MQALTGIDPLGWTVFAGLALGAMLLLWALLVRFATAGSTVMAVPAAATGVVLIAVLAIGYPATAAALPARVFARPEATLTAALSALLAFALVDVIYGRVVSMLSALLGRFACSERLRHGATAWVVSAIVLIVAIGGLGGLAGRVAARDDNGSPSIGGPRTGGPVTAVNEFDVPGQPMDIALTGPREGYIALREGQIVHFTLSPEGAPDLILQTVMNGLTEPRGLAVSDGRLYVSQLGEMPCENPRPLCKGAVMSFASPEDGEAEIIAAARGAVRSFAINDDGSLDDEQLVLSDLPVAGGDHGVNGIVRGPEGMLYLAIGNVDQLWATPERATALTPHPDWFGTVLRFDSEGSEPQVYVRGLRNVYNLAFDDRGQLWAVDNDGPTISGWRYEEVLQLKEGRHYGFPRDGTLPPWQVRDDGPVWISRYKGSAGIAWAGDVGLGDGLLLGSCGEITQLLPVPWRREDWIAGLEDSSERVLLDGLAGCVTSIRPIDSSALLASLYGFGDAGRLYLVQLGRTD